MKRLILVVLLTCASLFVGAARAEVAELSSYEPAAGLKGTIRIWGHGSYGAHTDFVEGLTRAWQDGFRKHHPDIVFDNRLHGTASAIGALYTNQGDLALMGREIWPPEIDAFKEVRGYAPTGIDVLTGSFDVRNKGYALVVFVHKDNPIENLSFAQLDAVFGMEHRRGHPRVTTWGDLGLTGEWRDRPIRRHGLAIARGFAEFFESTVFDGGRLWNPDVIEYADDRGSKGGATDGGQKLLDALALDRDGIGYSGLLYHHADVKPIALSIREGESAVFPTRDTVQSHDYPLTRVITMFLDRKPGSAVDPKVAEFLRYILSRDGQKTVIEAGHGYLPLPSEAATRGLERLK